MKNDYIPLENFDDKFMQANREHTKELTDTLCKSYQSLTDFLAGLTEIHPEINIDEPYSDVLVIMEFAKSGDYIDRTKVENMIEEDYKWQPRPIIVRSSKIFDDKDYPAEPFNSENK